MNILIFLGSGVSYKTGLPDTKGITDKLLYGQWHSEKDLNYYSGKPNPYFDESDISPKIQKFLRYIKEYADEYLRPRLIDESNYETIYYIVKQLYDELYIEADNPLIGPFIDHLYKEFDIPNNPDFTELENPIEFKDFCSNSVNFINCVIWHSVYTDNTPIGFDLLSEIIKSDGIGKIDIATLNHDLIIEKFLYNNNFNFTDAFSEPNGDFCYFNPDLYISSENKVRLFKLHGSIDWHRLRDYDKEKKWTTDFYIKLVGKSPSCVYDKERTFIGDTLSNYPIFLTGTMNKLSDYNFGIIRAIHLRFDEILFQHNVLIMSGYGWNDKGINGRLMEWILSSGEKKIILLHEDPESIKKSRSSMWHRYDDLVKWGRLIPVKKWMSDTKLEDIIKYL